MPAEPASPENPRNKRLLSGAAIIALAALVYHFRSRIHFDWGTFFEQLRHASPIHILLGIACILSTYWFRSARWAVFISPMRRIPPFSLVGSQFIGFTAVAIFGRLADLTRPYLISRRVGLSVSSQVAVYTIERLFDLAATAIIFSFALAFTPRTAPHHEIFVRTGVLCILATAFLALFALAIRRSGVALANRARSLLGRISRSFGESIADKILGFREGLNAIATIRDLFIALALSIAMWALIGESYVQAVNAFTHTPELATLPFSRVMLLMATSMGASLLQLPIIGWFTQITAMSITLHTFYGAPVEASAACAGVLLIINLLCIIPFGLLYGRIERVSLQAATRESAAGR